MTNKWTLCPKGHPYNCVHLPQKTVARQPNQSKKTSGTPRLPDSVGDGRGWTWTPRGAGQLGSWGDGSVSPLPLHHLNYNVLSVTSCVSISPFRSQLLPLLCGIVSLQTNPPRTWSQSLPKTSSRLSTKPATGQQPFICALDRVIRGWTEPDRQEPGSPDNKQFIKFTKTSTRLMG